MSGPLSPTLIDPQLGYDALEGVVTRFLGYRPDSDELSDFPFEIYDFMIKALRNRDTQPGSVTFLMKRFLMGPQEVWVRVFQRAGKLRDLYDANLIEAKYLPSQARLIGFGRDLNDVLVYASEIELRRIVSGAIAFWRQRWLDSGLEAAIRLVTGNRFKIRDYFDYRFIIGETLITEDLANDDPNMLSVQTLNRFQQSDDGETQYGGNAYTFHSDDASFRPEDLGGFIIVFSDTGSPDNDGIYEIVEVIDTTTMKMWEPFPRAATGMIWFTAFPYDEYLTEIRLVDEPSGQGVVNRDLLEKLLDLQRPSSERINIVYVDFMDLFTTPNDLGQWEEISGTGFGLDTKQVVDGKLILSSTDVNGGGLITNRVMADDWGNYTFKTKAALASDPGEFTLFVLFNGIDDNVQIIISMSGFASGQIELKEIVSGTPNSLGTYNFSDLVPDVFWTYTIEVFTIDAGVDVRILLDGNLIIHAVSAVTTKKGNIVLGCSDNSTAWINETELWEYPLDISRVGPNP